MKGGQGGTKGNQCPVRDRVYLGPGIDLPSKWWAEKREDASMIVRLEVEVERVSGKFVSKEDVAEELVSAVDIGSIYVDDSEYEITNVVVVFTS